MNRKTHLACNFSCFFYGNEGLLKVTTTNSHVRRKCGNISESVQLDKDVVATVTDR